MESLVEDSEISRIFLPLFSPNPNYAALLASLLFFLTASFYPFFNTSFLSLRFIKI
jgi:hypothetical protein